MPLHLVTTPHLAPLLDRLAGEMARAPLPPREAEVAVVQSQGMRRWVTLQLADRFGCAASLELPFPTTYVRELARRVLGEHGGHDELDPFSRDALTWRLDAFLAEVREDAAPAFAPLRTYLAGADARTRFGLAAQLAARLDDYQLFRADLLAAWEAGEDTPDTAHARWQAALWRRLRAGAGAAAAHTGARLQRLIELLGGATPPGEAVRGLPARLTVFGVSALPPLFIDLLAAVARHRPVTVYAAALGADAPHPLASAYGAQSREFVALLQERGATVEALGRTPDGPSLLATLQRELANGADGTAPLALARDDDSLRVHDAHGDLRQLEVVRDQLLAALAADSTLRPHDLLLLVPDAAEWAPKVDAVFGVNSRDLPRIPYRIADRPMRRAQPAAEALARLLALEGGRMERSAVLALLSLPLVRQGAGLAAGDVEWIEGVLARANVRWGYDGAARSALGFPGYEEASWREGLDRLLLGVAVGPVDDEVLSLLPQAGDLLGDPELLGAFAQWVDDLADMLAQWRNERTLPDWVATMLGALERFVVADSPAEHQMVGAVAATIRRLSALGLAAGYEQTVPFAVVRDWLEGELDGEGFGTGFLQGGMTVAALKPMRSLPFRVVAMVGLDDGVFPRRDRRSAFDLLEHERRAGDRDLRSDDRQLFLDSLLAAGDRFILAYGGRAVSDNSERAPSVVVDELLDHVGRRVVPVQDATAAPGAPAASRDLARELLVLRHPLQPFSASYFTGQGDPRLFSFSREQAGAARALAARREEEPRFVTAHLPTADGADAQPFVLTLRDLTACWMNPSRYFCSQVLRLRLGGELEDAADEETFAPNDLEKGMVRARVLSSALAGTRDDERDARRMLADGALPPRELGRAWYDVLRQDVDLVMERVPASDAAQPIRIDVRGDGWQLKGYIDGVRGGARYAVRAGPARAEHLIRAWVEHLVMLAAREQGHDALPDTTVRVWRKGDKAESATFSPVSKALLRVSALVESAREGLRQPLPFFPQAGEAWMKAALGQASGGKGKRRKPATPSGADPREMATESYHEPPGNFSSGGDAQDAHVALCFRGVDPMDERWDDFEALARRLFDGWVEAQGGGDA